MRGESWLYSASVILLPLIYSGFALAAGEGQVALCEMLVGTPFIVGGVICLVSRIPLSALIVGALWILHAVFDLIHDALFVNTGVPGWYPVFCAAIDLVVGAYILRLARWLPRAAFRLASGANVGPGTQSQ
ncbi:hypothetical protein [Streptomyces avermitilis]|uniref:hypothetical protein n=1 Tax=Streptomyces avermitilis TaxID=33903 RepID=UPI0033AD9D1F